MLALRAMTFERCSGQIGHEHRIDSDSSIHVRALEQPLPYTSSLMYSTFTMFFCCAWCANSTKDTVSEQCNGYGIGAVQRIRHRSTYLLLTLALALALLLASFTLQRPLSLARQLSDVRCSSQSVSHILGFCRSRASQKIFARICALV